MSTLNGGKVVKYSDQELLWRSMEKRLLKVCFQVSFITVSIHCAPEMSEIDCIGRIESFWPKFVRGGKYFGMFSYS